MSDLQPLPPTTTAQQDLTVAGQRKVNLIWEYTQAAVALMVVFSNMTMGVVFGWQGRPIGDYPPILSTSLFLIIGFYFSRTNHSAIGGTGIKPEQVYIGR